MKIQESNVRELYRSRLATHLGSEPSSISLFWKGRVGFFAILEALKIGPGDEVILPAFTCVVVPNAIIYRGAKPVYAEINQKTYNVDISSLDRNITARTRAIVAQNTFGLSPDLDSILDLARSRHIQVIEDACHGFGSTYKVRPSGTSADVAFFSSQWNKPFSTGIGGFTFARDSGLSRMIRAHEESYLEPSRAEKGMLTGLMLVRDSFLHPNTYWALMSTYRTLSRHNLVIGSSTVQEIENPVMPLGFHKRLSYVQARRGLAELGRIEDYVARRRRIAKAYHGILSDLDVPHVHEPQYTKHGYLRYPIRVKNRVVFAERARRARIELGDWFVSPVHPVQRGWEKWGYATGSNPIAEMISAEVLNLPTHDGVDESYLGRIGDFLTAQRVDLVRD